MHLLFKYWVHESARQFTCLYKKIFGMQKMFQWKNYLSLSSVIRKTKVRKKTLSFLSIPTINAKEALLEKENDIRNLVILSYIKRKWSRKIPYIYLVLRVFSFPYLDFLVQNIKEREFQNPICTAKSIAPNKVTYRLFCDCLVNWIQFQKKNLGESTFSARTNYIYLRQNKIWSGYRQLKHIERTTHSSFLMKKLLSWG